MHDEAERRFFDLLARQHGVGRTRQAESLGVPGARLRWLVRRGRLRRLQYGIVAAAGAPPSDGLRAMHGVLLGGHGLTEGIVSALGGPSAAFAWKLISEPPREPHIVSTRRVENRAGFRFHRTGRLPTSEVTFIDAIPTTDPVRTFLDYCAIERPWTARNLYYRALREKLVSPEQVMARIASESRQGREGLCLAREIASATTAGAERARSGWEEAVYGWILEARLPLPERNVHLPSSYGFDWEVDMLYRDPPIAIEVSPWDKHADPKTYLKDLKKREDLEMMGFTVIVVADLSERTRFIRRLTQSLGA